MGLALGSAAIIIALQWVNAPGYGDTVSAYGIITRVMTFCFLPLLGLSHAMQTITGNNYGARDWARSDRSLRIAVVTAFVYALVVQSLLTVFAADIGRGFVDDPAVVSEVERVLPIMVALLFAGGPLMMIAMHFQAIGDASRAALLGLSKPYLFGIPLTFILADMVGERGIWMAGPFAELLLFGLTLIVLFRTARTRSLKWGLFQAGAAEQA
ncbi:MATE family efflux transporter [Nitratireductor sp. OM-1]|uniref:MATE family efflux transporter n=1 Tax=Nitratireductor sp. OM-1 TaxID=1756988 RepID=UPI001FE16FAC|nr:MATE family efflux transporter [Nitratireductor sp. OM-1]